MQAEAIECKDRLAAGQLWRVDQRYVFIVELGKRLIHYKMLQHPKQRAVVTRMIGVEALLRYLKESEAELVNRAGG